MVDGKEKFYLIFLKGFIRIIMTLVVHYDIFELNKMNVEKAFVNDNICESLWCNQWKYYVNRYKVNNLQFAIIHI